MIDSNDQAANHRALSKMHSGNRFRADDKCTQARAVELFEMWVNGNTERYPDLDEKLNLLLRALPTLRGKNLACWCRPGTPCHADVLIRLPTCYASLNVENTNNYEPRIHQTDR